MGRCVPSVREMLYRSRSCACKLHIYNYSHRSQSHLSHWGRVTHICASKLSHLWFRQWLVAWTAASHYPNQCRNIVNWTISIEIDTFSCKKMHLKMSSGKWRPFCLDLNVLTTLTHTIVTSFLLNVADWQSLYKQPYLASNLEKIVVQVQVFFIRSRMWNNAIPTAYMMCDGRCRAVK